MARDFHSPNYTWLHLRLDKQVCETKGTLSVQKNYASYKNKIVRL